MKALIGVVMAAALILPVRASPAFMSQAQIGSPAIQVRDGCGEGFHRGPEGYCRENGWERERRFERLECPRGYHLGPEGRRCWPN